MRRVTAFGIVCLILLMALPSTHALPAEPTNRGAVFGGQHAPIDNLTSISTSIDQLPAIAEDFTATWCTNCLKAEAALDELEDEGLVQKYEFHRAPDFEDPLGDEAASTYITERYDVASPPLVAFNGTIKKIGTKPDSDSLVNDYREMIATPLNMGNGISTFAWTPKADCNCDIPDNSGIISWNLDLDMADYPNNTLNVHAWFVEQVAEYSDGGNGAGEYHDVVRKIVDLGTALNGTATVEIPSAYDGDDLEVHLVYVMTIPELDEEETTTTQTDDEDDSLPGFMTSFTILAIAGAAMLSRRE